MIGDSWQLRKHSLLGHWAAHSAEPPGPWQNGRKKRGGEKRWGCRRAAEWGELAENQEGDGGARANTGREIYKYIQIWRDG